MHELVLCLSLFADEGSFLLPKCWRAIVCLASGYEPLSEYTNLYMLVLSCPHAVDYAKAEPWKRRNWQDGGNGEIWSGETKLSSIHQGTKWKGLNGQTAGYPQELLIKAQDLETLKGCGWFVVFYICLLRMYVRVCMLYKVLILLAMSVCLNKPTNLLQLKEKEEMLSLIAGPCTDLELSLSQSHQDQVTTAKPAVKTPSKRHMSDSKASIQMRMPAFSTIT